MRTRGRLAALAVRRGHVLVTFALAVAGIAHGQGGAAVLEAVRRSVGEQAVAEDGGAFTEGAVAGDGDGVALLAFADQLAELMGCP